MKTINRTVLLVTPNQPYIDWANSFEDGGPLFKEDSNRGTAILIPDTYDEYNYENWVKKNWRQIFEEELESWMLDTSYWPEKLTYKMFKKWFTVLVADMVIDLGKKPIEMEEL